MPAIGRLRYIEAAASRTERRGQADGTVLLLHGFPLSADMWAAQLELAGQGWRVIAPDLRGMGGNNTDPPANSVDDYAGDVIDLLDALHVEHAVVVGLSLGGYVAFAMLRLAPRYVRGLVLADTRPQADSPETIEARTRMLAVVRERGAAGIVDEMVPKLLGETTRRERPDIVARVSELIVRNSSGALAGALAALMGRPDSTPLLSEIRCPTLVIVGEEDIVTPVSVSREMQRSIPGSELVIIPAAGHLSNMECPEPFNAALGRFLAHGV
jgi:pimeloyl-ACP methyl ester carboxylesterase